MWENGVEQKIELIAESYNAFWLRIWYQYSGQKNKQNLFTNSEELNIFSIGLQQWMLSEDSVLKFGFFFSRIGSGES